MVAPSWMQRLFWPIMIGVTVVVWIVVLGCAWYMLVAARGRRAFPPTQALCPDSWARAKDGKCTCMEGVNAGDLPESQRTIDPNKDEMRSLDGKRDWARKHRIQWDGVTNYSPPSY